MSRNGSGTYTLPAGNPVVTGTTITSSWANATLSNIADALTQSVSADGQTPITGAINMTGHLINNVTDPTSAQDAATKAYVDAVGFTVAPGTSGNVLTSNGTTWTSATPATSLPGVLGQAFTSSGTFTIPSGVTAVKVTVVGGGGSHSHAISGSATSSAITLNVLYANIIICSKN